jgi:hypothetical protein
MSVTVVIADDEALLRAGFRKLLDTEPDFAVVGEAADGVEAVNSVRESLINRVGQAGRAQLTTMLTMRPGTTMSRSTFPRPAYCAYSGSLITIRSISAVGASAATWIRNRVRPLT